MRKFVENYCVIVNICLIYYIKFYNECEGKRLEWIIVYTKPLKYGESVHFFFCTGWWNVKYTCKKLLSSLNLIYFLEMT